MKGAGKIPIPKIVLDVDHVDNSTPFDASLVGMALRRASFESAELVRAAWIGIAQESSAGSDYLRGIQADGRIEVTEMDANPDANLIEAMITITNTAKDASTVEDGHGGYSQVDRVRWGQTPRMKRAKDGTWYLTIPFQHSTYRSPKQLVAGGFTMSALRTMMPAAVYAQAKKLKPSRGLNAGLQHTPSGQYRAADRYQWGSRLNMDNVRGVRGGTIARPAMNMFGGQSTPGTTNVDASRFQGMVKMSGGKGHNSYLTFRVMTQKSKGWRMPAKAGLRIAARLLAEIEHGELGRAINDLVQARLRAAIVASRGAA